MFRDTQSCFKTANVGWSRRLVRQMWPSRVQTEEPKMLRLLHQELVNIGKLVAVTTSALNATLDGTEGVIGVAAAYIPGPALVYAAASNKLTKLNVCFEFLATLHEFHSRLSFCTKLAQQSIADTVKRESVDYSEIEYVGDAWRALCGLCICGIYEIEAVMVVSPARMAACDSSKVIELLQSARDGNSPCVENGRIVVPGWAERRRHERLPVSYLATLTCAGLRLRARVIDISLSGIGLDEVSELPIDSRVTVSLDTGRTLEGIVRWQEHHRAGVELLHSLSPRDPLFVSDLSPAISTRFG